MAAPRLLVIDDDPALAESLGDMLRCDGYEVDVARDGLEGLALVRGRRPQLVVLDLDMPGLDGEGFLDARRAVGAADDPPVLIFTAVDDDGCRPEPVYSKPFGLAALIKEIHRLAPPCRPAA
jgi:DNA-binding response OmpR family regulator